MKKYKFSDIVFTPDEFHQIKFDDKKVHLSPLQSKLLMFFVENPGKIKKKDEILKAVWGTTDRSYEIINRTLHELREKLPNTCAFTSVHRVGYAFEHDVIIEQAKFDRLEYYFAHSPAVKYFLYTLVIALCIAILASSGYGFANLYYAANPPPPPPPPSRHELENIDPLFTRDYTVDTPQLSPDGRFIAHNLSSDLFVDDHLGLLDLKYRDTKPIVPMSFLSGYKWNLTGDKIVYQNESTGECEIRLLSFYNEDKTQYNDEHLKVCPQDSGQISFAWFNDNEFYTNFVSKGAAPTANNLPLHHLYRFNIQTKDKILVKRADYTGGFGFYALEYDPATKLLYFLQTHNMKTTDIYQYDGTTLTKKHTFNQFVPFFTVADNKLVYKNTNERFVITDLNEGFDKPQALLRPRLATLNKPNLQGNKLVYLAGNAYKRSIHQLTNGQLTTIDTRGFTPEVLANYNNQLVFAAEETGVTQVYLLTVNNKVKQLSHMAVNEHIRHLKIAGDYFVISYANKVAIYQMQNETLTLIKEIQGFNRGVIDKNGELLLLSYGKGEATNIVEKRLSDIQPTGRKVTGAKFAFYHQGDIVYLDKDKELLRITENGPKSIADNIAAEMFAHISVIGDVLYYLEWYSPNRPVFKLNLTTGIKTPVLLNNIKPIKLQAVNNSLFIGATGGKQATIVMGDIVAYK